MKASLFCYAFALLALLMSPSAARDCACDDECGLCDAHCQPHINYACVPYGYCHGQDCSGQSYLACICCEPNECSNAYGCLACPAGQECDSSNHCCTPLSQQQACAGHNCGTADDGCGYQINCGTCPTGQQCVYGTCTSTCTSSNCPNGCCDSNGVCQPGIYDQICGTGGQACNDCGNGWSCINQQCFCSCCPNCP